MLVKSNRLKEADCSFETKKFSQGSNICDFIIIHFTGSYEGVRGDINTCLNPQMKVSWHLTVNRNGDIYQHADFRKICWHAGKSFWNSEITEKVYANLNKYSIGIEIDNAGKLTKQDDGSFTTFYNQVVPEEDVVEIDGEYWERFTDEQISQVESICHALIKRYKCIEILGHSDIAPGRKVDPGPAFPMEELRSNCYG